jgi:hypothetical protein
MYRPPAPNTTRNQKTGIKLVIQLVKQLGFDFTIEKSDLESDILI